MRLTKKDSEPNSRVLRAMTNPMVDVPAPDKARAAWFGCQSRDLATSKTRALVASETPTLPFKAKDAAVSDTPARRATSLSVIRFATSSP